MLSSPIKIFISLFIFIVILLIGYFFDISDQQNTIKKLKAQAVSLKTNLALQQNNLIEQEKITHNLATLESFITRQTHGETVELKQSEILQNIHKIGAKQQISFRQITPQKMQLHGYHSVLPIEINMVGNYQHIASFISKISNLDTPIVVQNIQMKHNFESNTALSTTLFANIYILNSMPKKIKYYPKYLVSDIKISPIALPEAVAPQHYTASHLRNPFTLMNNKENRLNKNIILLNTPLSKIKLLGTITGPNKKWAIIMPLGENSDKITHNVFIGNRISQSRALIIAIHPEGLVLKKQTGDDDHPQTETVTIAVSQKSSK